MGFLPAIERGEDGSEDGENTFSMYHCKPKCEEGQQEVSFLVLTDQLPVGVLLLYGQIHYWFIRYICRRISRKREM